MGFTALAETLAARGVASIRMDFPGCGANAAKNSAGGDPRFKAQTVEAVASFFALTLR